MPRAPDIGPGLSGDVFKNTHSHASYLGLRCKLYQVRLQETKPNISPAHLLVMRVRDASIRGDVTSTTPLHFADAILCAFVGLTREQLTLVIFASKVFSVIPRPCCDDHRPAVVVATRGTRDYGMCDVNKASQWDAMIFCNNFAR